MKREYQINALDELTCFAFPGIWQVIMIERGAPKEKYYCHNKFINRWNWFGDTDVKSINGVSLK
jgi:hypothetical protein